MANVPTVEEILAELSPLPIAEGRVTAYSTGWVKAYYFDPVTGLQVKFATKPALVVSAETRSGSPPTVKAPTISIPSIALPAAPTIDIPAITIPPLPTITIPDVGPEIDNLNNALNSLKSYRFTGVSPLVGPLNSMMDLWITAINYLQTLLGDINLGFINIRNGLQNIVTAIGTFGTNAQDALNTYRGNIQTSLNAALADMQSKAQAGLNAFRDYIQTGVNNGLAQVIPALYDQIGVPLTQLISTVQYRNVTNESFEFYSLSPGYTVHYEAIGPKIST
jgi:hypothetical protein